MGEYTEGIERINIELQPGATSSRWSTRLEAFFASGNLPLGKSDDAGEIASAELLEDRVQQALALLREVGGQWRGWLAGSTLRRPTDEPARTFFALLQDHTLRASWKTQIRAPLQSIFAGAAFKPIVDECETHPRARCCKGRVWVALHMHAGDGNVHTNIPVNSDNYEMLQTAHAAVARIMKLARSLDGVISGEHGIGITKLEFLTDDELAAFTDYKQRVDPEGRFNKGKLLRGASFASGDADVRPGRPDQRLHAELRPDGARVADHAAERHRRRSPTRSRTACAAASASRCARRTCRAPTCSTARATRSSRPRCWSRPSCTRSRRGAASRFATGRSSRTWPTTAPSATSA